MTAPRTNVVFFSSIPAAWYADFIRAALALSSVEAVAVVMFTGRCMRMVSSANCAPAMVFAAVLMVFVAAAVRLDLPVTKVIVESFVASVSL